MTDDHIVLLDVDEHEDGADGRTKQDYLRRAAELGVWKKHDRIVLPLSRVAWVKRLGELHFD